jgi:hypothetical protein
VVIVLVAGLFAVFFPLSLAGDATVLAFTFGELGGSGGKARVFKWA